MRGNATGAALIATACLVGCATTEQISNQVLKSNVAQETASNQLLLLNIVRAYKRRPMHFTQISAIRLPTGYGNPTFTIPTPFGPDFVQQVYGVSTSLAISQGVDTQVMNSQEFMRGITTPLPPSTMAYYLEQGWPTELILFMFVRKIEVYEGGALVDEYLNYPEHLPVFSRFKEALDAMRDCQFDTDSEPGTPYGPELEKRDLGDIKAMAAAKTAELAIAQGKTAGSFQLIRPGKAIKLTVVPRTGVLARQGLQCELPGEAATASAGEKPASLKDKGAANSVRSALFVMRSPEAMLYYLGEIARAQLKGQYKGEPPGTERTVADKTFPQMEYSIYREAAMGSSSSTLFRLATGAATGSALSVDYEGQTYWISDGAPENRSTHVLSLLTQVFGLQNKGNDLPTTTNVHVVP
jgi:hypothetical protein